MSLPVIVLGAGGHAKVLMDILRSQKIDITGITDPSYKSLGPSLNGIKVLGSDEIIMDMARDKQFLVNGLGSVNNTTSRANLYQKFKGLGFDFLKVIHPMSIIADDATLSEGSQIMAGAIIQPGSSVGINVIINTKASIDHDCIIGNHVHIAPGATLSGGVEVGEGTHIGTGATIIQGIKIGSNCLIGAGAVVIHDVPSGKTVMGVPAREIHWDIDGKII